MEVEGVAVFLLNPDLEKGFLDVTTHGHGVRALADKDIPELVLKCWPWIQAFTILYFLRLHESPAYEGCRILVL